jgi:hypothetical protein
METKKTKYARVRVRLTAEYEVDINVAYSEGTDPTHLSVDVEEHVLDMADKHRPQWVIDDVEEVV